MLYLSFLETKKPFIEIEKDWLEQCYAKSGSINSKRVAETSMRTFEDFIRLDYPGMTKESIIEDLKKVWSDPKTYTRLYQFLNFYVQHLSRTGTSPKSSRIYFSFVKSNLIYHGIRIHQEEIKQFVRFGKIAKERRSPIAKESIISLLQHCNTRLQALMLTAVSSGARVGELAQLRVMDVNLTTNPIQIRIRAATTKTMEERYTFCSKQAGDLIQKLIASKQPTDFIFYQYDPLTTIRWIESTFNSIRKRAGLLDKYENGRYRTNIHALRAFFITVATKIQDENYSHALAGHHKYMDQYYRMTLEESGQIYLKIESEVTIDYKPVKVVPVVPQS